MLHELLRATRAHVGFALRTGGEQALANVLHVAELARQYELGGGISFRGFVEELRRRRRHRAGGRGADPRGGQRRRPDDDRAQGQGARVPGRDPRRPDVQALARRGRALDRSGGQRSARVKLGGWAPTDLLLHGGDEAARDRAEGERLAYVAATRARDVLVVPAIGDEVYEGGWLDPLMPAIYPSMADRRKPAAAVGCPVFPSKDTVLSRPDGDPARTTTVAPGQYEFASNADSEPDGQRTADNGSRDKYQVVWWDPRVLALDAGTPFGLRRDDLIAKDGDAAGSTGRLAAYRQWEAQRTAAIADASRPSISSRTVTQMAADRELPLIDADALRIEVVELPRVASRPFGPRFGTLVHTTLATVPLDADEGTVRAVAATQGRILLGSGPGVDEEVYAVVEAVTAVLRHPLFDQVRAANAAGRCYRELPLIWQAPDGTLIEGTIDLAFEEPGSSAAERRLVVLDFKTDRELDVEGERYRRQLAIYCQALVALQGGSARGILMRV